MMDYWPIILPNPKKHPTKCHQRDSVRVSIGKKHFRKWIVLYKNVGNFSLNADKNLIFTPYDQTNYLTNSLGERLVSPMVKESYSNKKSKLLRKKKLLILFPKKEEQMLI